VKRLLPLITIFFFGLFSNIYSQKGATKPTNSNLHSISSLSCPLSVYIQDNIPAAVCSELLKTLVAVTATCTDTTAVSYRWSSSIGGVFSTSRTTTFNLPEFFIATNVTFTVWVVEGSDSLSANYTINVKPRPNSPSLTPFGTIVLCDNNPVLLTSSVCTAGSTTVWSNGASNVNAISVPAIGGTYYSVACYKNGCISDSTAAAAFITGIVSSSPTTANKTICEGTTITTGNGLQANLVNCNNGTSGTYAYTGGTVGYDIGYISNGSINPAVSVPSTGGIIKKVSISITWRKQKGGFQNDCGTGDTQTWPYHNETQFSVKSPSGKIITLVNTNTYGGSNNPTVTTLFEDGASPVNYYSPPVSGTLAPSQPLSGFIGENPAGTWTLLPFDAVWKDPLCVSGFSVTFSDAQNGTLTWWDSPTGGNQVGTGAEFIPTVTSAGTYTYYAQAQCVKGCPSVRTASTLTIQPTPPTPIISVSIPEVSNVRSICTGESITLTATGCNNGGTVRWNSSYSGTNFATGSSYTLLPTGSNSSNVTHTFTSVCEGSNLCKSVDSGSISVVVKYKPSQPTIFGPGASICANSSVTLSASACSGGTLGWTGNRSESSITFNLTGSVNIKTACSINGCTSDSSNVYSISSLPKPNALTVNSSQVQAVCYGSSVTLTASACVGTVKWTGNLSGSPITVTPLSSRNYKASCLSSNGCSSDSSAALNIVVLPKSKPTISGNTFVCGISSVTLTASGCSGTNETVVWRNESTGITFTQTISQTKTFRAVCIRNGYCVSDSSDIFTIQYRIKSSQPIITPPANTTICQGTGVSLTASACAGGTLGWTGGLIGQTISVYPNTTKSYEVACVINGCVSDSSLAVSIMVNPTPVININSNKTSLCSGDYAFLTVSGCTGTILWSNGAASSIIKVSPTSNTTYTSTCALGSCSANQSVNITVLPAPSITTSGLLQCGQTVTLTTNNVPAGSSIQWRKDGVDIVGATSDALIIGSVGSYDFTVGATISTQLQINTTNSSDIRFVDLNNGYVFNANILWKTTNGGTNWGNVYSHTSNFEDVYFVDSNNGWAITQQNILKTTNGGLNWTIYNNNWSVVTLSKMTFKDHNTGIIITNDGRSLATTNGGVTWTLNTNPVESNISSWQFKRLLYIPNTNNILLAYRSNGTTLVKLIKSMDTGTSWTTVSFPNVTYFSGLEDISFVDSNNGWLVGFEYDKLLMKTVDGGNTWTRLSPIMSSGNYNKVDFITPQIGYVQALDYSTFNNRIFKTKDGGYTWSIFKNIDNNSNYLNTNNIKIKFLSEDNGWYATQAPNTNQSFLNKISTPQCPTIPKIIQNNCCNGLETLKSGSWTDPTTWSCNRMPTSTDDIFINTGHTITDNGNTIHAKTLNYRGGILQLSTTTNFILR
jgi:photosystem II stability/assembly factor-like uncharacterized protein